VQFNVVLDKTEER